MGQTVVEKVVQAHAVDRSSARTVRAGDVLWLSPRHVLTHDNTAPVIARWRGLGATRIHDAAQPVIALDHDIQNRSDENLAKYREIERFARVHDLAFFPAGTGIGHQIVVERLYATPGALVVAADSHANTYGGVGALGLAVTRADAAGIWAGGSFWWRVPRTVEVALEGRLPPESTGKDMILALCATYCAGEVQNAAVEFSGPGVATLSVDDRLAIANMTTEWGSACGWFPADEIALRWFAERLDRTDWPDDRRERFAAVLERAPDTRLGPDADASYAARIVIDLASVEPHVAGPDTVHRATPLAEIERQRIRVNRAYLVSCANSRASDLAAAAEALGDGRVAEGVELYVAAASRAEQEESERRGDWGRLLAAGARPLPAGCGPCIGLGLGLLAPGETGISATNRNFRGRMGSVEARCYLASPPVVAASAVAGVIRGPRTVAGPLRTSIRWLGSVKTVEARPVLVAGFPPRITGRLVLLDRDDLDTDAIYAGTHTYRDAIPARRMAELLFENYDAALAARLAAGDILVGGRNFGCGSSREQAVTALRTAGVALIVAASIAGTYRRNALNNGLCCVEAPELVAWLRGRFGGRAFAIPGESVELDFGTGVARAGGETFPLEPPDAVAQTLVAAGGLGGWLARRVEER